MADKHAQLLRLYDEWAACTRCELSAPVGRTRRNVVFGEGNADALVMIVGEGPGAEEDRTGSPFVGASGELVDSLLESVNASRDDVFITNVVACRPTKVEDYRVNRPPEFTEIKTCFPRLQRIIDIVDPFVVLMLGETAFKTLCSDKRSVTKVVEDPFMQQVTVETMGLFLPVQRTGFVSYHPSFLLRNSQDTALLKRTYDVWKKAFEVADTYALLYRGVTPPSRE